MRLTDGLFLLFILMGLSAQAQRTSKSVIPEITYNLKTVSVENQPRAREVVQQFREYLTQAAPIKEPLRIQLSNGIAKSVHSKPGYLSDTTCREEGDHSKNCQVLGQINNQTVLSPTGKIRFQEVENEDDRKYITAYLEIEYQDTKGKKQKGWIPKDVVSFQPNMPLYNEPEPEGVRAWLTAFKKWCQSLVKSSDSETKPIAGKGLDNLKDIQAVLEASYEENRKHREQVAKAADALSNKVGACMLNPPDQPPRSLSNPIVYDQHVLPFIKQQRAPAGVPGLTDKKMHEIDALARTIFAEMASCVPVGPQYPMAVGRILKNRARAADESQQGVADFIPGESRHASDKTTLMKVATSPVQISAWNREIIDFPLLDKLRKPYIASLMRDGMSKKDATREAKKKYHPDPKAKKDSYYKVNTSGHLHTLCPPSDPDKRCYTGGFPNSDFHTTWQDSLRVATEAVLFPEKFDLRTKELANVYNYTSGRNSFDGAKYIQVRPSIENHAIENDACLNLWEAAP